MEAVDSGHLAAGTKGASAGVRLVGGREVGAPCRWGVGVWGSEGAAREGWWEVGRMGTVEVG